MGVEKLQYLLAVEKTGNISKAAELLYMSQPSLSKSIASVEKEIGCKIFQRTPTGLKPTPEGQRYLTYARQALELREEALSDLKQIYKEKTPCQRFVLGLSPLRSSATLSRSLLNFFNSTAESIELHSKIAPDAQLEEMVCSGEMDMAVITLLPDSKIDPSLSSYHLCSERLLLAVSSRNPVLKKVKNDLAEDFPYLSPQDLKDQRFILSSPGSRLYEMTAAFFRAEQICPHKLLYEDYIDIAKESVAKGLGICFVNERLAKADPREDICYCRTEGTLPIRNVYAIWRKADLEKPDKMMLYHLICDEWQQIGWDVDEVKLKERP